MKKRHPNRFVQSDIEDAERTRKWLQKADMRREKKWIDKDKNIPCAWYAAEVLAPANGIRCLSKGATIGMDRRHHAYVTAKKGDGIFARTHGGASSWNDRDIAICFAYRNAIRQLLPMQPDTTERVAYRDRQDNAIRKYA